MTDRPTPLTDGAWDDEQIANIRRLTAGPCSCDACGDARRWLATIDADRAEKERLTEELEQSKSWARERITNGDDAYRASRAIGLGATDAALLLRAENERLHTEKERLVACLLLFVTAWDENHMGTLADVSRRANALLRRSPEKPDPEPAGPAGNPNQKRSHRQDESSRTHD